MPPTGSSASWRECAPLSTFVSVGKDSRWIAVVVISVACSAAHSNIISDTMITPAKNASFDHCWKSSYEPMNSFGRPRPSTSMRLGVVARLSIARTASASPDSPAAAARTPGFALLWEHVPSDVLQAIRGLASGVLLVFLRRWPRS